MYCRKVGMFRSLWICEFLMYQGEFVIILRVTFWKVDSLRRWVFGMWCHVGAP